MPYRSPADFSWHTSDDYAHARRVAAAVVLVLVGWATGFFTGRMSAWIFPVNRSDTAAIAGVPDKSPARAAGPAVQATAAPPAPQPADDKQKAAAAPAPVAPAAPAPVVPPAAPAAVAAPPPASATVQPERSRPKEEAAAPDDAAKADAKSPAPPDLARKTDEPAQEEARKSQSGVVLVNPDWTRAKPNLPPRAPEAERERERESLRERDSLRERESLRESMYDGPGIAECERRYSSFRRSDGTYQPYGRSSREVCPFLR